MNMNDKVFPTIYKRDEFIKLVSDVEVRDKIQNFPEMAYGDDNAEFGISTYELSIIAVKMSDGNFIFTIAYQGIKAGKIDTLIYAGPDTDLAMLVSKIEEELKDVDY